MKKNNRVSKPRAKKLQIVAHTKGGVISHFTLHGSKIKVEAFNMDHDELDHDSPENAAKRILCGYKDSQFIDKPAEEHIRDILQDDYNYAEPVIRRTKKT